MDEIVVAEFQELQELEVDASRVNVVDRYPLPASALKSVLDPVKLAPVVMTLTAPAEVPVVPFTVNAPPVGPALSATKVKSVVVWLPTTSLPTTP